MIFLIHGATHTGKTMLAQKLLETWHFSVLSQDHLKMGLIRSDKTKLTVFDDEKMVEYLWPITREIMKTAIENHQNLIIEGCYVPFDWRNDFEENYLQQIESVCLVMSERYLLTHQRHIMEYDSVIEKRLERTIDIDRLIEENGIHEKMCQRYELPMILIDKNYDVFEETKRMYPYIKSDTIEL